MKLRKARSVFMPIRCSFLVVLATSMNGILKAQVRTPEGHNNLQLYRTRPTPNPKGSNPVPEDAQQAILALFDTYEVVGGMNTHEGNKDVDDFILNLVRNPVFPEKVNDIAVECGNSLYQPILDRYIAGEDVPLSEVRQVWRNTTQPSCGFSVLDEQLPSLVRRINQKLPPGKKLRILALDPPVDWSKIASQEDMRPFMNRDASIYSVMEKEVFAKHRKALMTIGVRHILHYGNGIFDQQYPNATFVITNHWGFGNDIPASDGLNINDELEMRMASWPVPSLVTMKDTWLADLPAAYFSPDVAYPMVDGYLYLGPRDVLVSQPVPADITLDSDYMAELQRRAKATGRPAPDLEQIVGDGVFFYDPARH